MWYVPSKIVMREEVLRRKQSSRNSLSYSSLEQMAGHEIEAELELVLDIRVEISGGKIICHPQAPPATV